MAFQGPVIYKWIKNESVGDWYSLGMHIKFELSFVIRLYQKMDILIR